MNRKKQRAEAAKQERLETKQQSVVRLPGRSARLAGGATEEDEEVSTSVPAASTSSTSTASRSRNPHELLALGVAEYKRQQERRSARSALESRFIKLSPLHVEHYRQVLAKRPFGRPVPPEAAHLRDREDLGLVPHDAPAENDAALTCPKRPKWKYYMKKKEVEKNESVMFEKWLADVEDKHRVAEAASADEHKVMGYFERNLDVWRQLWRVCEASEILLVLLDVRCPMLHFPPSLQEYLRTLKPRKKCILVLTKVDLVPELLARAWKAHLEDRFGYDVVLVESYREHAKGDNAQGTRARFDPGASYSTRKQLVATLRSAHAELCAPPPWAKPERRAAWRPPLRSEIDWTALEAEPSVEKHVKLNDRMRSAARASPQSRASAKSTPPEAPEIAASGLGLSKAELKKQRRIQRHEAVESSAMRQAQKDQEDLRERKKAIDAANGDGEGEQAHDEKADAAGNGGHADVASGDKPFLSIGLIGQPNVGKSSLLNALLGKKVVRASRTPGKTKTLQTIFWMSEVRLVDCPGLVFPSYIGMEKQVVSAVIPVQNVESVVYELAMRMPLEQILQLGDTPRETYDGREYQLDEPWSTDSLLSTFAIDRGCLTAKAARPDVYRSGSMLIRAFQSSQIPWSFRPSPSQIAGIEQDGIWITQDGQQQGRLHLTEEVEQEEMPADGAESPDDDGTDGTAPDRHRQFEREDGSDGSESGSDIDTGSSGSENERQVGDSGLERGQATSAPMRSAFQLLSVDSPESSDSDDDDDVDE